MERSLEAGSPRLSLSSLESRAVWEEWFGTESKKLGFTHTDILSKILPAFLL